MSDNNSAFSSVGDLSALRSSELLYVYPIIFDSKLEKKFGRLIRDFQTLQFMSQIKVANIINLTKSAVRKEQPQDDYISPSEMLSNVLNAGTNNDSMFRYQMAQRQNINYNSNVDKPHPKDLEYKLQEKYEFIKSHLKSDPRYYNLDPIFSLITVEHTLIEIPLILGSKIEKINSQAVFWILYLAAATKLPLDNSKNINTIANQINRIPSRQYMKILDDANIIKDTTNDTDNNRLYNRLKGEAIDELKKAGDKFNRLAGNIEAFQDEIGISTAFNSKESIQFSTLMADATGDRSKVILNTNSLLTQMLSSSVFPVIQTYNNIIVEPNVEVNFPAKYNRLHSEIIKNSTNITESVIGQVANVFTKNTSSNEYAKNFQSICSSLHSLNPNNELSVLSQLVLSYSNIRSTIEGNQNNVVSDVNETVTRLSYTLFQKTQQITDFIQNFTSGATDGQFDFTEVVKNYRESTERLLRDFFYGGDKQTPVIPDNEDNRNIISNIFARLYNDPNIRRQQLDNFVSQFITAIAGIITFSYLFSAIGYICDFIKVIDNKVKVEEASVISFPNYTLVVPIEYLRMLYFAIGARNITNAANDSIDNDLKDFNFKETEIFRILTKITDVLKIPNLVVIDEKSKAVYYKWTFSRRLTKVNLSTIEGYNRSQKDVIRV